MPDSHAQSADGLLLICNGIDPVLRWDGLTPQADTAGIQPPGTASSLVFSGTGTISGTYYTYTRFLDAYGNVSNLSPLSLAAVASNAGLVTYSAVPTPSEPKVVLRQILRNTSGQTGVFYVDIETIDLTTTTFTSTKTDTLLQAGEGVPLLDLNNRILANLHGVPPADKSAIAAHLDRMFMAGEEPYTQGCVACVRGSYTVSGIGTEWPATFASRFLWISGADQPYEIDTIDPVAQSVTLLSPYAAATNPFATYAIRPPLAQRRLVQFTEAGQPESWPATNAISVQEDGDEITGLMPKSSFLYILLRRHIYRLTFQSDPLLDGFVYFASGRGCVNNRCWVVVDENAYLLDEAGVYILGAGNEAEAISTPIQDIFETGPAMDRPYKIHWPAARWFHCCYDPGQKVIRWFVSLAGSGIPRHALAYDLLRKAWWIEEFARPIGASVVFRMGGESRVALGGPAGQVYLMSQGTLDQIDPDAGTHYGAVSSASPTHLADKSAQFAADVVGAPVVIVEGKGQGQIRVISARTSTVLTLRNSWTILPDATSIYQVGAIQWVYRTGWFRFSNDESDNPRRLEIVFEPVDNPAFLNAQVYYDRSREPVSWGATYSSSEASGFASNQNDPDLVADLTKAIGFVQRRLDGHRETYIDGPRFVQVSLHGAGGRDGVVIHSLGIDGASD